MASMTADDRGQLLLIAAIGLSVLFVMLALVLNTAIYTENLAAQDTAIGEGQDARSVQHSVAQSTEGILRRVNEANDTSYDALSANVSSDVVNWGQLLNRHYAAVGATVNVSVANTQNGTRIVQENASRNFTNASAAANWTVAESATGVRDLRLNVTREGLTEIGDGSCSSSGECYSLEIDNGSATWRLFTYTPENESNITVEVVNASGGSRTCTTTGEYARINVTAGTLAGSDCQAFALNDTDVTSDEFDITYVNGDRAVGSYHLIVDRTVSPSPHFETDGSPSVRPAIYSATVRFRYRSADMIYDTELRVIPGDGNA